MTDAQRAGGPRRDLRPRLPGNAPTAHWTGNVPGQLGITTNGRERETFDDLARWKVQRGLHPPAEERSRRSASEPLLGRLAEEVVHDHTRRLVSCLSPRPEQSAYYWRGELGREVDVVMTIEGKPIPIEGRFRADPRRDLDGRHAFLESHSAAPFGLVVTRDLVELREGTLFLPLSCFLLMI